MVQAEESNECITLVFDKTMYLPHIRQTIHTERKTRISKTRFTCPLLIRDEDLIPHGELYAEALTDKRFKTMLIDYISLTIPVLAKAHGLDVEVIIDSPTFGDTPVSIKDGETTPLHARKNNKGEADCGVWFHAACSHCDSIFVHAGDTDVFMYGLSLYDQGHFQDKQVVVERATDAEYVDIRGGCAIVNQLPQFKDLAVRKQAWTTLLAIYLLSGSDYVSGFFRINHEFILKVFIKYLPEILLWDSLLKIDQSGTVIGLSESIFTRFISFVYLEKHTQLFSHLYPNVTQLKHALFISNGNFSPRLKTLLSWLQYDVSSCRITTEQEFNDFVRRVCFFNGSTTKDLFKIIMPSDSALSLHCLRGAYVLQLAMESVVPFVDSYMNCNGGWVKENGIVKVKWENDIDSIRKDLKTKKTLPVVRCGCKSCTLSGRGCVSCWKKCVGCTSACHCKGLCNNPHNPPGGTCNVCVIPDCTDSAVRPVEITQHSEEDTSSDESLMEESKVMRDQGYFQDGDLEGMCEVAQVSISHDYDEDIEQIV
jgi:hypothetical protein